MFVVVLFTITLCACGGGDDEINLADSYVESLTTIIATESGTDDINPDEHVITDYTKDNVIYTLIFSKTQKSNKEVYYLVRTMEIDKKFITDRISEDADLSEKLTPDNPYIATTMQNHTGDVFFYIVKVLDDSYHVLRDGEDAFSPQKNLFVETGDTEPVLEIVQKEAKK